MKHLPLIALVIVPLLFSCLPKKPEMPGTEVPAGPLLQKLEKRNRAFTGLKAIADATVVADGRRRVFDTVGIVLDGRQRLRVEAFGPLGQSVFALVWDGTDVLVRLPDEDRIRRPGSAGIERMLGIGIGAEELWAVLSAAVPVPVQFSDARAYCTPKRACVVEYPAGAAVRRVWMGPQAERADQQIRIAMLELYQGNRLVYRARYERMQEISQVLIPRTVVIENPENKVNVTINYTDAEVNVPMPDDAFRLADPAEGAGR